MHDTHRDNFQEDVYRLDAQLFTLLSKVRNTFSFVREQLTPQGVDIYSDYDPVDNSDNREERIARFVVGERLGRTGDLGNALYLQFYQPSENEQLSKTPLRTERKDLVDALREYIV